ncbi:ABC transporter permease [bacterium]|nr:ABC transporter permease [bacterium]
MRPIRPILPLTQPRLIVAGLRHYWRAHAALALAAAVGVAVLTGSLLVGDSVRGSLREHALARLGNVDQALIAFDFFRASLADSIPNAAPAIMSPASVAHAETGARASRAQAFGVDEKFWRLMRANGVWRGLGDDDAIINSALARQLQARPGDEILVRVQKPSAVPRETFLGEREETIATIRLRIARILNENGDFAIAPTQTEPLNVFVPIATLARRLEQSNRANVILVPAGNDPQAAINHAADLTDAGIKIIPRVVANVAPAPSPAIQNSYMSIESTRIFLPPDVVDLATQTAAALRAPIHPTLTYLANAMTIGARMTPYSTVAALDDLSLRENEIALNAWTADDLNARIGDTLRLAYFEPTAGRYTETTAMLTVAQIVPMTSPLIDRGLTPDFPGIVQAESLGDWDPPFPMDMHRIRPKDEEYWDKYRAAPKAFVSLAMGKKLWANRYGDLTSIRVDGVTSSALRRAMRERFDPARFGLILQPIRQRAIDSSQGSSDFSGLFIGFSFFLLVSAAMLIHALFSLGVQSRSREFGILSATGFNASLIRRLMLAEGAAIAAAGAVIGILLGLGYAALLMHGLRTWWIGAVGAPFLSLHAQPASLATGFIGGWAIAMFSIFLASRGLARAGIRGLLAGRSPDEPVGQHAGKPAAILTLAFLFIGFALAIAAPSRPAAQQAGLFFGAGASLLVSALVWARHSLRRAPKPVHPERLSITRLGILAARRRPGRSMLVIALMACATFIVVAVGAQRQTPPDSTDKHSGSGGFALIAESSLPIYQPLDPKILAGARAWPLRLEAGDDPSCFSLYKAARPRVAGAGDGFIRRGGFEFAQTLATSSQERENPWLLLNRVFPDGAIPAIADSDTVTWLLHSGVGKDILIDGHRLRFVALLKWSIFPSELIISERKFIGIFQHAAGWRLFAIESPPAEAAGVSARLESRYADFGFDAVPTRDRLAAFMAVENTYLSIFMALGGLGLLLGTLGMALALLRNLVERRRELALLRAVGFGFGRLLWLAASENLILILIGMAIGAVTALVAVLPAALARSAPVPWPGLAIVLAAIAAFAAASVFAATTAVLRSPVIKVLKQE